MTRPVRAGVIGRGDAYTLAAHHRWCLVLPATAHDRSKGWVDVLFAVVGRQVFVRRYRFEVTREPHTKARTVAFTNLWRHTVAYPKGAEVYPADDDALYRPPLDVIEAAVCEARRLGGVR